MTGMGTKTFQHENNPNGGQSSTILAFPVIIISMIFNTLKES
jgi:hypothetical protein